MAGTMSVATLTVSAHVQAHQHLTSYVLPLVYIHNISQNTVQKLTYMAKAIHCFQLSVQMVSKSSNFITLAQ
jgi:hypothetical protein